MELHHPVRTRRVRYGVVAPEPGTTSRLDGYGLPRQVLQTRICPDGERCDVKGLSLPGNIRAPPVSGVPLLIFLGSVDHDACDKLVSTCPVRRKLRRPRIAAEILER